MVAMNTTFWYPDISILTNSELFVNTKYILNFAIACYTLPYLAIVHMNYCVDFSTRLY